MGYGGILGVRKKTVTAGGSQEIFAFGDFPLFLFSHRFTFLFFGWGKVIKFADLFLLLAVSPCFNTI